jgi:hypothetical protein
VVLTFALTGAIGALAMSTLQLDRANTHIEQQRKLLDEQDDRIQEQERLIERKETFSAAMHDLVATASEFDGALFGTLVPHETYQTLATRGWSNRWDARGLELATDAARAADEELAGLLSAARSEASANHSGTTYEAVLDRLGDGFVTASIDDADALCEQDVLGCVVGEDPYTVHFDAADASLPYMTDWLRTGLAYHEFAHVLQMTNLEATEEAVTAFGGDRETMADCFALTYLDGWELDHEVWVSDAEYWEVSMGYGHTCSAAERRAVRDWYGNLGYESRPISQ